MITVKIRNFESEMRYFGQEMFKFLVYFSLYTRKIDYPIMGYKMNCVYG